MESPNWELEFVGMIHHCLKIRNSVTVSVDMDLAAKGCSKRFPEQLLWQILVHIFHANSIGLVAPVILALDQSSSLLESVSEVKAFAHAAEWSFVDASMDPLGVLSACHLHKSPVAIRVCEHVLRADFFAAVSGANGVLDSVSLAAHVVTGPRKDEGGGDTA